MASATLFFVLIGVGFVSGSRMKAILWLDQANSRHPSCAL